MSGLGLIPGDYQTTWGSGSTAGTYDLQVLNNAPEPSTLALVTIGIGGLLGALRRRK